MHQRKLTEEDRQAVQDLLAGLPKEDLAMRFCVSVRPEWVARYVETLSFDNGVTRGVFDKDETLLAMSQLAGDGEGVLEFAVVVHPKARGQGLAGKLLTQAKEDAAALGAKTLAIHCLGSNIAMVRTAHSRGIAMRNRHGEMEGHLDLRAA